MNWTDFNTIPELVEAGDRLNWSITHADDEQLLVAVTHYVFTAQRHGLLTHTAIAMRETLKTRLIERRAATTPQPQPPVSTSPK
jgi:hypothetical protein